MEQLQGIREKYQPIIDHDRNAKRMALIIDFLSSRPILSILQASDGLGIPFKTAGDYLAKLERAGVLKEITGYARNRVFQVDKILRAVQGNDNHFIQEDKSTA